jgi:hypothetical protein
MESMINQTGIINMQHAGELGLYTGYSHNKNSNVPVGV